jgi:hypothetical protein
MIGCPFCVMGCTFFNLLTSFSGGGALCCLPQPCRLASGVQGQARGLNAGFSLPASAGEFNHCCTAVAPLLYCCRDGVNKQTGQPLTSLDVCAQAGARCCAAQLGH